MKNEEGRRKKEEEKGRPKTTCHPCEGRDLEISLSIEMKEERKGCMFLTAEVRVKNEKEKN